MLLEIGGYAGAMVAVITLVGKLVQLIGHLQTLIHRLTSLEKLMAKQEDRLRAIEDLMRPRSVKREGSYVYCEQPAL
ncbi:hypothetical protein AWM75_07875 [Aerococcus urinaehominis]|uniref:Uncharacterized protein n=1 Tax=Aerococcus urinaehominis TaxID=128944 RepID=A0A0X8FMA1_9LACT|nr:hypothetical protein [Aerococcus urinaehominis]AMB99890.1 hypothetical protein AWM75_07875 [Aerococcus urinaehominis]SDM52906.1 hypothetical protein SAMN04487985_12123 [Aerococcus urinaehominis]